MTIAPRPFVTFAIFTYNQEKFIRQAVEAALAQTYSPLEIIISDDASSDNTVQVIHETLAAYSGPHQIRLNINQQNLGIGQHVNKVFELARGEFLVLAAGDDISLPSRTERIIAHWLTKERRPSAIYCGAYVIDVNGVRTGTLDTAIRDIDRSTACIIGYSHPRKLLVIGACSAYSPDVYRSFDPLLSDLTVEDIPLSARASMLGGVDYIDELLMEYRANVSVWLPRRLPNEDFERHRLRMAHRIRANHMVSMQLLEDVKKCGNPALIKAACKRHIATEFSLGVLTEEHFSIQRYFHVLSSSPYWKNAAIPAALFAFPTVHRLLFELKKLFHRERT